MPYWPFVSRKCLPPLKITFRKYYRETRKGDTLLVLRNVLKLLPLL